MVEYQGSTFPAPLPVSIGRFSERVVDEQAAVKLLEPANPLLSWPNKISPADFDGWVEERGHGFLETWDKGFTAITETADPGQDPRGAPDPASLWMVLDSTPEGRGADWYPKLEYQRPA